MYAARICSVSAVKTLAPHECGLKTSDGYAVLMLAAIQETTGAVELLVAQGGGTWSNEKTALLVVAESGHKTAVDALAYHEKDLKDEVGLTALMHAAKNGHADVVRILAPHEKGIWSNGRTALLIAAENNQKEVADSLARYEKGLVDDDGLTALVKAAKDGDQQAVALLLCHEKTLGDKEGRTALMYAA